MTTLASRRLPGSVLAIAIVAITLIGCATSTGTPGPTTGDLPATATPVTVNIDDLLADVAAADGTTVTVQAFLLITGDSAQICGIVMESFPPQCGGPTIRVLGEVPADVVDSLDRTDDPTLAQARWGWVDITGTVDATGADGTPSITVDSISIAER
ncbi:MAG TPA: hypothetical protein VIH00_03090 [Candidatus Limnocylindrales bacterium]